MLGELEYCEIWSYHFDLDGCTWKMHCYTTESITQSFLLNLSASSAGSSSGQRRRQRIIPTNDELLYDPDEDDRDQAWVDARRRE